MKNLLRVTLAATMLLAASGLAHAQDYRGERDGQHYDHRGEPSRHEGWDHHHEAEYRGGYREPGYVVGYAPPVYAAPVYAAPVYAAPVYAAPAYAPAYGYAAPEREDDGANVAGAVVAGAVATGILATILLAHH